MLGQLPPCHCYQFCGAWQIRVFSTELDDLIEVLDRFVATLLV